MEVGSVFIPGGESFLPCFQILRREITCLSLSQMQQTNSKNMLQIEANSIETNFAIQPCSATLAIVVHVRNMHN